MQTLIDIQTATRAARCRLEDEAIATRAEAGKIQVVRVNYADGNAEVAPISQWMPVSQVVGYLNAL